jgi:PTS system cellobiose-specific IIC component
MLKYFSAIRSGMVSIVPLTIVGGLFMIVAYLPVPGWEARVAPYLPLLQIPVAATFGILAVVACFSIAYDLGKQLNQEAVVSAMLATVTFLLIQIDVTTQSFRMDGLGSKGYSPRSSSR